jgi:hypothetical protein
MGPAAKWVSRFGSCKTVSGSKRLAAPEQVRRAISNNIDLADTLGMVSFHPHTRSTMAQSESQHATATKDSASAKHLTRGNE